MRMFTSAAVGLSLLASVAVAAPAFANPAGLEFKPGNAGPGDAARSLGGRGYGGGFGGGHGYRGGGRARGPAFGGGYRGGGYRRHGGGYGAAVGAGVAGLAAGALIGGAIANQGYDGGYGYGYPAYGAPVYADPGPEAEYVEPGVAPAGDAVAYCESRFKSYDRSSGTYLGYDGDRHPCP